MTESLDWLCALPPGVFVFGLLFAVATSFTFIHLLTRVTQLAARISELEGRR